MKKITIFLTLISLSFNLYSQTDINDYKYVIIPTAYDFLGENDKYQLNSLTKFLFNKYGYTAFIENESLPQDLTENRCLGMKAELEDKKGFLRTKVQFHLKDCNDQLIMSSRVGDTKEKSLEKAFPLAVRDAFETFRAVGYKYKPNGMVMETQTTKTLALPEKTVEKIEDDHKETKRLVEAINEDKDSKVKAEEIVADEKTTPVTAVSPDVLYAQPIENGFQIVDTEPKKVMILYYSGVENVFIVKDKDAIVYKDDGKWIYSHVAGTLQSKVLNIKF